MTTLKHRFKDFRIKHISDTGELAASKLEVSSKTISLIENGRRLPSSDLLILMHTKYGLDVNWLLSGKGKENPIKVAKPDLVEELYSKYIDLEKDMESVKRQLKDLRKPVL